MFEAVSQTSNVQNSENIPKTNESLSAPVENATEVKRQQGKEQETKKEQVSQSFLNGLEKDIEMIHNVGLRFSVHKPTGRTVIKVIDKETQELVREIPAEEILNLAAKLDDMLGIIFDETV